MVKRRLKHLRSRYQHLLNFFNKCVTQASIVACYLGFVRRHLFVAALHSTPEKQTRNTTKERNSWSSVKKNNKNKNNGVKSNNNNNNFKKCTVIKYQFIPLNLNNASQQTDDLNHQTQQLAGGSSVTVFGKIVPPLAFLSLSLQLDRQLFIFLLSWQPFQRSIPVSKCERLKQNHCSYLHPNLTSKSLNSYPTCSKGTRCLSVLPSSCFVYFFICTVDCNRNITPRICLNRVSFHRTAALFAKFHFSPWINSCNSQTFHVCHWYSRSR